VKYSLWRFYKYNISSISSGKDKTNSRGVNPETLLNVVLPVTEIVAFQLRHQTMPIKTYRQP